MSAEVLRLAAALMRERAESATPGPWEDNAFADGSVFVDRIGSHDDDPGHEVGYFNREPDAAYVAAMAPPLAFAMAEWLEAVARQVTEFGFASAQWSEAVVVAHIYLGEQP